jgi:hypothetical protein
MQSYPRNEQAAIYYDTHGSAAGDSGSKDSAEAGINPSCFYVRWAYILLGFSGLCSAQVGKFRPSSLSRPILVTFTDGSKRHVNRRELDTLRPNVKELNAKRYLCTIPFHTVRMTATENTMAAMSLAPMESFSRWPGPNVIVELGQHRYREYGVESPYATLARLERDGPVSLL